jgi:hypothetical protein
MVGFRSARVGWIRGGGGKVECMAVVESVVAVSCGLRLTGGVAGCCPSFAWSSSSPTTLSPLGSVFELS